MLICLFRSLDDNLAICAGLLNVDVLSAEHLGFLSFADIV